MTNLLNLNQITAKKLQELQRFVFITSPLGCYMFYAVFFSMFKNTSKSCSLNLIKFSQDFEDVLVKIVLLIKEKRKVYHDICLKNYRVSCAN